MKTPTPRARRAAHRWLTLALGVTLASAAGLAATTADAALPGEIFDPVGDFLPGYTGPRGGDLDVLEARVTFDSANITLSARMNDVIGHTPDALYVWGVNRGAGTEILTTFPNPNGLGVFFDSFIVLGPTGNGQVVAFNAEGDPTVHNFSGEDGVITIDGSSISAVIPESWLPSRGFSLADYGYNIWPRFHSLENGNQVSDLAPDASSFQGAGPVPEPASWAMMIVGLGMAGSILRRRQALQAAHRDARAIGPVAAG
jgi:hypothetical protein